MENQLNQEKQRPEQNGLLHGFLRLLILILTILVAGIIALVSYSNPMLIFLDVFVAIAWYFFMIKETINLNKQDKDLLVSINIGLLTITTVAILVLSLYISNLH